MNFKTRLTRGMQRVKAKFGAEETVDVEFDNSKRRFDAYCAKVKRVKTSLEAYLDSLHVIEYYEDCIWETTMSIYLLEVPKESRLASPSPDAITQKVSKATTNVLSTFKKPKTSKATPDTPWNKTGSTRKGKPGSSSISPAKKKVKIPLNQSLTCTINDKTAISESPPSENIVETIHSWRTYSTTIRGDLSFARSELSYHIAHQIQAYLTHEALPPQKLHKRFKERDGLRVDFDAARNKLKKLENKEIKDPNKISIQEKETRNRYAKYDKSNTALIHDLCEWYANRYSIVDMYLVLLLESELTRYHSSQKALKSVKLLANPPKHPMVGKPKSPDQYS